MADDKGVMILAEPVGSELSTITTEALGCGRKLADELGEELSAVLIGKNVRDLAQEAIAFGAEKVYVVEDDLLADYQVDAFLAVMEGVVRETLPKILLLGQTYIARDLAPRLAFRLKTGLAMDCVELEIDSESGALLATRPVYGGNALAVFSISEMPQMATVRPKAMTPLEKDESRTDEIISITADHDAIPMRVKVIEKIKEDAAGIKLEEADVIVSGGRGIGDAKSFDVLVNLAKLMKGAVGATKAACDFEWVPASWQIGLTGKIVSPNVYFAVALSGASQHMAGCSGAKTIIAINKDPNANIFTEATLGIIGDWKKVLPALTEKIEELLSG
jgi:electron transfer flavoprotein alpha subunit